jgi:hypothetical protein
VGRLAAGLTGAVYGDTMLVAAVVMVTMLMVVMGTENVVVPASAPWRPTATPLS